MYRCGASDCYRELSLAFPPSSDGDGVLSVQRLLDFYFQPGVVEVKCDSVRCSGILTESEKTHQFTDVYVWNVLL